MHCWEVQEEAVALGSAGTMGSVDESKILSFSSLFPSFQGFILWQTFSTRGGEECFLAVLGLHFLLQCLILEGVEPGLFPFIVRI